MVAETNVPRQIKFKAQDAGVGNALIKQIIFEQGAKRIGFAAPANFSDIFHLSVPHIDDELLQISVTFDFHRCFH